MIGEHSDNSQPDIDSMLRAGVDIDDDGDFDPTDLLQQPLDRDIDELDELGINVDDDDSADALLATAMSAGSEGDVRNDNTHAPGFNSEEFRNEAMEYNHNYRDGRKREELFDGPTSSNSLSKGMVKHRDQYNPHRQDGRYEGHFPDNDHYDHRMRNPHDDRQSSMRRHRRNGSRRSKRNQQRIAEVQQRIAQVQQQIRNVQHESMDEDQLNEQYENHPGSNAHQERFYENFHHDESFRKDDPRDRTTGPHYSSQSPHSMARSFNGIPDDMHRDQEHRYRNGPPPHRRARPNPPSPNQRSDPMMSHRMRHPCDENSFDPRDQMHGMSPMTRPCTSQGRSQSLNDMPHPENDRRGHFAADRGGPAHRHQHVVGGMSQSLNDMPDHRGNGMHHPPNMGPPMSRSLNGSINGMMSNMNMNANNTSAMPPRRGIQSMSDSLNGLSTGNSTQPNVMNRSNNGNIAHRHNMMMDRSSDGNAPRSNLMNRNNNGMMDRSKNGNIPQRGILSRSSNGSIPEHGMMDQSNNGNIPHSNMMDRSNNGGMEQHRGIQSMSASLNAQHGNPRQMMSQSMNAMSNNSQSDGYGPHRPGSRGARGPQSNGMSRSLNAMPEMPRGYNENGRNRMNAMESSMNGMSQVNNNEYGPPKHHRGNNSLQGMSQSLNRGPQSNFSSHIPHGSNRMSGSRAMGMSNNGTGMIHGSNESMNISNAGNGPALNNSNVPSAPLLNQVSNLANLPNRGGGNNSGMIQSPQGPSPLERNKMQGSPSGGSDGSKMGNPMALAEATMRSASSRKMIRELGLSLMKLQRNSKSGGLSKNTKETVVKAKRKSGRESYSKLQLESALRDQARQMKAQLLETA